MTTSQLASRNSAVPAGSEGGSTPPAPQPESHRPPSRGRPRLTGARRLGARAVLAVLLLAALCATAVIGAVTVRGDTSRLRTTVSDRAAVATQLRFALADLDAQHADTLAPGMSADGGGAVVGNQLEALITAQQRRAQVSDALRRLSGDEAHSDQVRALLDGLGHYDDLSGRASYVDEQAPDRLAGHPPAVTVALNAQAGAVMTQELLPTADRLASDYQRQADDEATKMRTDTHRWALVVGLLGLVALLFVLWWQRELARDYRRLLSPPLAAATAAVLAVCLAGVFALTSCASAVDAADHQGLRPWSRLAEASAVATQAAAAESRWFVQGDDLGKGDAILFTTLTKRLDTLLSPDGYATPAERPAYEDVLTRYHRFRADDTALRRLKDAGKTDEAAVLLTTVGRGDIAFDFWDFATTLDDLAGQQLDDFAGHTADARGDLGGWPAVPAGALGAAGLLVLLAIRPRLAEYQ
ncbi:hypothetical protein SAMN05216223_12173 [Actinacidiphila yanglinensis]|uniref:Uncharacterized protein n=1 Tax=Actinacidiphila yanglinensis TaxID=310779 RepID=A0A1H6DYI9_9ACTN|nr:hypothetical protein [Actinacidiphila yanglinensis]SEG90074.1 hypothetical protein SAMN05216223_12173 [Actinacidiphila yanglinensis]